MNTEWQFCRGRLSWLHIYLRSKHNPFSSVVFVFVCVCQERTLVDQIRRAPGVKVKTWSMRRNGQGLGLLWASSMLSAMSGRLWNFQTGMIDWLIDYRRVASSRLSWLVAHPSIFRLFIQGNLMLIYCDLLPKGFKIESKTGVLHTTIR